MPVAGQRPNNGVVFFFGVCSEDPLLGKSADFFWVRSEAVARQQQQ
jgi:hypothetical protein